nr:hypothetical protein [Tanacetum cinerariifolium]
TVSKVPETKDTIKFKLDTQEITYTVVMFHDTLHFPIETPNKLFIAPVNIKVIESFMQIVGYQGVADKKKDAIQYPHFTKLIITNLMKKFPSIPQRLDEDYHTIKDDISLEYETVFVGVEVLMNQPQPVVSTQGTHDTTPRAHRIPTLTAANPQGKKRKQSAKEIKEEIEKMVVGDEDEESYASEFADSMLNDDVDDSGTRIEPGNHKENLEVVDDDDVNDKEKQDESKDDNVEKTNVAAEEKENDDHTDRTLLRTHAMGSMKNRNEPLIQHQIDLLGKTYLWIRQFQRN